MTPAKIMQSFGPRMKTIPTSPQQNQYAMEKKFLFPMVQITGLANIFHTVPHPKAFTTALNTDVNSVKKADVGNGKQ
jgi:hypothetical protein